MPLQIFLTTVLFQHICTCTGTGIVLAPCTACKRPKTFVNLMFKYLIISLCVCVCGGGEYPIISSIWQQAVRPNGELGYVRDSDKD